MRLTERLLGLTLVGSEWVLWVLIALSVLSVAVMVERAIHLSEKKIDLEALGRDLVDRLSQRDVAGARKALAAWRGPEIQVLLSGIVHFEHGFEAVSSAMASSKAQLRIDLERYLGVLATLGNNAPFIGLFGTVLGIIRAFADLARNQGGGAAVVMAGISEALVATAVGLMVAIPAVIAFNYFQGKIRRTLSRVDATGNLLLTVVASGAPAPRPAAGVPGTGERDQKAGGG
jgi:biopolymer transport protein ExbB